MIVILTRNEGYRKKEDGIKLPPFVLKKYPNMRNAINSRNKLYNSQLDFVDQLEKEGIALVLRPEEPMTINRIEKDTDVLIHFYNHGYKCAETALKNKISSNGRTS